MDEHCKCSATLLEQIKKWRTAEKRWAKYIACAEIIGYERELRDQMEKELQNLRIAADREWLNNQPDRRAD